MPCWIRGTPLIKIFEIMEEIVSFKDGTSAYVDDNSVVLTSKKKSKTPMYAVICIDSKLYQCMPSNNNCQCCAFYNEKEVVCSCREFPCFSTFRDDGRDCIFVEVIEEEKLDVLTTDNFKKLSTYRFKI